MAVGGGTQEVGPGPAVGVRLCTIDDLPLLTAIDISANPVFERFGHPEFTSEEYESVPFPTAVAAIEDGRLLGCDLVQPSGDALLVLVDQL